MKLVFFTDDNNIVEILSNKDNKYDVSIFNDPDDLSVELNSRDETVFFIDRDLGEDLFDIANGFSLKKIDEGFSIYRVLISSDMSKNDLRRFILTDDSTEGFLTKPLTEQAIFSIAEDYELLNLNDDAEDEVVETFEEMTFVGINRDELLKAARATKEDVNSEKADELDKNDESLVKDEDNSEDIAVSNDNQDENLQASVLLEEQGLSDINKLNEENELIELSSTIEDEIVSIDENEEVILGDDDISIPSESLDESELDDALTDDQEISFSTGIDISEDEVDFVGPPQELLATDQNDTLSKADDDDEDLLSFDVNNENELESDKEFNVEEAPVEFDLTDSNDASTESSEDEISFNLMDNDQDSPTETQIDSEVIDKTKSSDDEFLDSLEDNDSELDTNEDNLLFEMTTDDGVDNQESESLSDGFELESDDSDIILDDISDENDIDFSVESDNSIEEENSSSDKSNNAQLEVELGDDLDELSLDSSFTPSEGGDAVEHGDQDSGLDLSFENNENLSFESALDEENEGSFDEVSEDKVIAPIPNLGIDDELSSDTEEKYKKLEEEVDSSNADDLVISNVPSIDGDSTQEIKLPEVEEEATAEHEMSLDELNDVSTEEVAPLTSDDSPMQEFSYRPPEELVNSSVSESEVSTKAVSSSETGTMQLDIEAEVEDKLDSSLSVEDGEEDIQTDLATGVDSTATVTYVNNEELVAEHKKQNEATLKSSESQIDSSIDELAPVMDFKINFNENDLLRSQVTLRRLREERDVLLAKIDELEDVKRELERDAVGVKAHNDELNIELTIARKRFQDEIEELKVKSKYNEEKRLFTEEKLSQYQKEFDRLSDKVRIDFGKVKHREKELESKLELMTMDSAAQIETRDNKIMELKRRIDTLEFNVENLALKEQKLKEEKVILEERLGKMMKSLRSSIQVLEHDLDYTE